MSVLCVSVRMHFRRVVCVCVCPHTCDRNYTHIVLQIMSLTDLEINKILFRDDLDGEESMDSVPKLNRKVCSIESALTSIIYYPWMKKRFGSRQYLQKRQE